MTRRACLLLLALECCGPEVPAAVTAPVLLPVASSASSAPSASVAAAPPCVPHVWPAVDVTPPPVPVEEDSARVAHEPAAEKATCARIEAASKRHMTSVYAPGPGPFGTDRREAIRTSSEYGCTLGVKGAWIVAIGAFRSRMGLLVAPYTVEYVAPDGKTFVLPKSAESPDAPNELSESPGDSESNVSIGAAYDYDGDGLDEVLVFSGGYASINGYSTSTGVGYRFDGAAVGPWSPVPGRMMSEWRDVDRDGRPDILIANGSDIAELAHSLPGGTFATDDEIARAFVHAQCVIPPPAPASSSLPPLPMSGPPLRVHPSELCAPVLAIDAACPQRPSAP
jgi:hypothetical protein